MKNLYFILLLLSVIIFSCKSDKNNYKKHESGLEYVILESGGKNTRRLKEGDIVILKMLYETKDGTVLFNSETLNRKYLRNVIAPTHKGGSFEDGLAMLSEGDSAIFKIGAENFLKFSEGFKRLPKDIKYDDDIIVKVKVVDVLDADEHDALMREKYHVSEEVEEKLLKNYLEITNTTTEPTESGLYYIEIEKGSGKQPKSNDIVSVHYTVTLVDGTFIETSLDKSPITFGLGRNEVIDAWEEGILYMHEGGKARFIAPSKIAYGAEKKGTILPYSTLVFEIELIKIL